MNPAQISQRRRRETLDALRRGTVPVHGLDVLAVGLTRFETAVHEDLERVMGGGAVFKAVRGEYGAGKTFFARWLQEQAKQKGMAVSEVQISEGETPLHRLESVYRRLAENLNTSEFPASALRPLIDAWIFALEEDAIKAGRASESDPPALSQAVDELLERRLLQVSQHAPAFAAALRGIPPRPYRGGWGCRRRPGRLAWRPATRGLLGAAIRGPARGARPFRGTWLSGGDDRGPARQRTSRIGRGSRRGRDTPEDAIGRSRQGAERAPPAHRRHRLRPLPWALSPDHGDSGLLRWSPGRPASGPSCSAAGDRPLDRPSLRQPPGGPDPATRIQSGESRRAGPAGPRSLCPRHHPRLTELADDAYIDELAHAVAGRLGGQAGIAPRLFLKKLVGDVLDRIDQFPDFNPRQHYAPTLRADEMSAVERNAAASSPDDVVLDLP